MSRGAASASDVEEYNKAVAAVTKTAQQLGVEEEEGFPELPRLNVGGTEFQTRLAVLRSHPGSLLSDVFLGEAECEYDESGRFFFDRDPTHFNAILNYYRTGECSIPFERGAFEAFKREVDFWKVEILGARCDLHYKKFIAPAIAGEGAGGGGAGGAAARKSAQALLGKAGSRPAGTPTAKAIFEKWAKKQAEMNGELVSRIATMVAQALNDGAALGYDSLTLTAFRPPETIGVSGLPPFRAPEWGVNNTGYLWDPTYSFFFSAARGFPILHASRDFLVLALESAGFKVATKFDEKGMTYEVTAAPDAE